MALRFTNVFGPFSYHKGSVVASFCKAAAAGEPLVVAAKEAWVGGLHLSLIVGAAIIAAAGLIALLFLPDRDADAETVDIDDRDGDDAKVLAPVG